MTAHRTQLANRLLEIVSPRTLASLIADIHCMGTGASGSDMRLANDLQRELEEMVGMARAETMIQHYCDAAYDGANIGIGTRVVCTIDPACNGIVKGLEDDGTIAVVVTDDGREAHVPVANLIAAMP